VGVRRQSQTVAGSLEYVAAHPQARREPELNDLTWELIGRKLYEIAMRPDPRVRGAMQRASKAQKIITLRTVGRRKPGSHPATGQTVELEFEDLTGGQISV